MVTNNRKLILALAMLVLAIILIVWGKWQEGFTHLFVGLYSAFAVGNIGEHITNALQRPGTPSPAVDLSPLLTEVQKTQAQNMATHQTLGVTQQQLDFLVKAVQAAQSRPQ